MHEYRDFEPGLPPKSYLRVARDAHFDSQRFFAAVAGSGRALGPALRGRGLRLGSALLAVALPWIFYLVLNLALILYGSFAGIAPVPGR